MIHFSVTILAPICSALVGASGVAGQSKDAVQPQVITIHYHRFDGDYEGVGVWTWDAGRKRMPKNQEIFPVGRDGFGLIFKLDTSLYGHSGDRIGLLPRLKKDWQYKDGGDRYWSPEMVVSTFTVSSIKGKYF